MLSWFQALMPKEERFFDLFESHADKLVGGATALRALLDGGDDLPTRCQQIKAWGHEADTITAETLLAVRRSFITPFDRSDIRDLICAMDDTIDQMHQTSKATLLYEVRSFDPSMQRMGDIIVEAARLTREALPLLRRMGGNAAQLNHFSEEISRIEEEADGIHDQGLRGLFLSHREKDPMGFIVGSELYGHFEKVVDGFEDIANRVSGIVIEHL